MSDIVTLKQIQKWSLQLQSKQLVVFATDVRGSSKLSRHFNRISIIRHLFLTKRDIWNFIWSCVDVERWCCRESGCTLNDRLKNQAVKREPAPSWPSGFLCYERLCSPLTSQSSYWSASPAAQQHPLEHLGSLGLAFVQQPAAWIGSFLQGCQASNICSCPCLN